MLEHSYYPIVYVRGYAGSETEVEDTVATPYMGFNLGSTKMRQRWTGDIDRYVFESPLIRLIKDLGYADIYEHGAELSPTKQAPARSVWIYRYYEPVSKDLGTGQRPEIEDYARGLYKLIEKMRAQVCGDDAAAQQAFRVHLVAHSMGGLIVRCYLQNICPGKGLDPPVDKVFTYATPHGGIDFRLVGNIPGFLTSNNMNNFNEDRMREYLKLGADEPVNSLGGRFDPNRFFSLVGTNARDYTVAMGASSFVTGAMGDGLVQIRNAYVRNTRRAFVHRAHSGHYGIVNSEEGYQNLRRFLFGKVLVDGLLDIEDVSLPPKVDTARKNGKTINASYHIEVIASVRKAHWDLHRRLVNENSAIFLKYSDIVERQQTQRPIQLFSVFLKKDGSDKRREKLGFSVDLGVLVPEYVVDGFLFLDEKYEGGYLFRDKMNLEVVVGGDRAPALSYGFDRRTPNRAPTTVKDAQITPLDDGGLEFRIPVEQKTRPGLKATLILRAKPWN